MGSWVRYRAIADDPIANNQSETNSRFTAYEICRGRQDDRRLEANLINSEEECGAAQVEVLYTTIPLLRFRHILRSL